MNRSLQDQLHIHGYGCVSAAGIGSDAIYQACLGNLELPEETRERVVADKTIVSEVRPVDAMALRAAMPKHPRLRRASNVSKFAITAAHEAMGPERIEQVQNQEIRLGIVMMFINGCVNYSNRFYAEVLSDPSLASPIIFPETVYNAPASHVAGYLKSEGPAYTLISDSAGWFSSMKIANDWLNAGQVDGCLILCAEELDWLVTEAFSLYSGRLHGTEGAAAVYLEKGISGSHSGIGMEMVGPNDYTSTDERRNAIKSVWQAGAESVQPSDALLVDGLTGVTRIDRDEQNLLEAWSGKRVSPASVLGFGGGATCGFQTVVALEALKHEYKQSIVMASGTNQHAFSARFTLG
ncbi:MAG: hypothetical protein KJO79_02385 [Verrucomicrobiae bacterium]|nr:hypothetical protein [Verrucomicrobiae bacterium]NNJ86002.1 hypothetical protein [Akkermansiaceae bacterium]